MLRHVLLISHEVGRGVLLSVRPRLFLSKWPFPEKLKAKDSIFVSGEENLNYPTKIQPLK